MDGPDLLENEDPQEPPVTQVQQAPQDRVAEQDRKANQERLDHKVASALLVPRDWLVHRVNKAIRVHPANRGDWVLLGQLESKERRVVEAPLDNQVLWVKREREVVLVPQDIQVSVDPLGDQEVPVPLELQVLLDKQVEVVMLDLQDNLDSLDNPA